MTGTMKLPWTGRCSTASGRIALAAMFAVALGGCGGREVVPLAVEFAGCTEVVRDGPTCQFTDRAAKKPPRLTLWVPDSPDASLETRVTIGGESLEIRGSAVLGGTRFTVPIPRAACEISVARGDTRTWRLQIATRPATPHWLAEATRLAEGNRLDQRRARESIERELPRLSAEFRARALSLLARLPSDSDKPDRLRLELGRAIAARRAAGQLYGEASDAAALAADLLEDYRLAEADHVLRSVDLSASNLAEAYFQIELQRAVVAFQAGNFRGALREINRAATRAERLGLADLKNTADQQRALVLQELGRFAEADALLGELFAHESSRVPPCTASSLRTNRGWGRLLAQEAGFPLGDPLADLQAARDLIALGRGCAADRELNAELNLALAFLQRQSFTEAERVLDQAKRLVRSATGDRRLWLHEIDARLALARGDHERALVLFRELAKDSATTGALEALWRARYGEAQVLADTPHWHEALLPLAESEDLLDRQALFVPQPGRARFATQREAGARLRVALLLRANRPREALVAARRAQSRVLRRLELESRLEQLGPEDRERWQEVLGRYFDTREECEKAGNADWQIPRDQLDGNRAERVRRCKAADSELEEATSALGLGDTASRFESFAPPREGELLLAFHRLPDPRGLRWVEFAADLRQVEAREIRLPNAARVETLASHLLAPFVSRLRAAERVVFLARGELRGLDFHAVSFDRAPLLASREVVYTLDLDPEIARQRPNLANPSRALVIGDPRGDLPEARREADRVAAALTRAGWRVESLSGVAATAEATRAAIARADLFHFAGHGIGGDAEDGGELRLARGGRLSAAEILTLEKVPRFVVLSGCETAVADRSAAIEGLGLAQAFLLRGAEAVVASIDPVPEADSSALFSDFYPAASERAFDLAALLARAQRRELTRGNTAALRFRVYVR